MTRLILLDAGPLGLLTNPNNTARTRACNEWLRATIATGSLVLVPEIADFEIRRELLRANRHEGVAALDKLADDIGYLEIDTPTWRRAAELWALVRNLGLPTADDKALDGDVLLAAQAQRAAELELDVVVATANIGHLGRYVRAERWEDLAP